MTNHEQKKSVVEEGRSRQEGRAMDGAGTGPPAHRVNKHLGVKDTDHVKQDLFSGEYIEAPGRSEGECPVSALAHNERKVGKEARRTGQTARSGRLIIS